MKDLQRRLCLALACNRTTVRATLCLIAPVVWEYRLFCRFIASVEHFEREDDIAYLHCNYEPVVHMHNVLDIREPRCSKIILKTRSLSIVATRMRIETSGLKGAR